MIDMGKNIAEFTDQNAIDVMTTACYGGITYWATDATPEMMKAAPDDASWAVVEQEEPDKPIYLTINNLRDAYFTLLDPDQTHVNDLIHGYFLDSWRHRTKEDGIDGGCIDATAADVIVQVACFGEVRFG